jgi:hypothetical protein
MINKVLGFLKTETQQQARERLAQNFKKKIEKYKYTNEVYARHIRLGMLATSGYLQAIMNDRKASHLFLELFLLFHNNKNYKVQHTVEWLNKHYAKELNEEQANKIHKVVLQYAPGRYF